MRDLPPFWKTVVYVYMQRRIDEEVKSAERMQALAERMKRNQR